MLSDKQIIIVDDSGKEVVMNIYFTFEANEKNYVVVYSEDDEDTLYPFTYDEDGGLFPIESDEELEMIDEVLAAYEEKE